MVQSFGDARDVLVRMPSEDPELGKKVATALQQADAGNPANLKRVEYVGPQVGEELRDQGGLGMLLALGGILLYVGFRFQWKFALSAILSLVHDAIIVMGVLSFFQVTFDLTVLAAVLAVVGYSLNDTIVIFDRVRENFRVLRKADLVENLNISTSQTLLRTIATSVSTLLAIAALLFFGGDNLFGFSIALFVGVMAGTYSSIYIANVVIDLAEPDQRGPDPAAGQGHRRRSPLRRSGSALRRLPVTRGLPLLAGVFVSAPTKRLSGAWNLVVFAQS